MSNKEPYFVQIRLSTASPKRVASSGMMKAFRQEHISIWDLLPLLFNPDHLSSTQCR
ncbi:MAG: hypothetical protein ACOYN4_16555 [Bacteroidales bacterium]